MFMTPDALDQFRQTAGWKVGADASVAIITVGIGGSIETNKNTSPVVGVILDPKGLMYILTLEGSKISLIRR
jgi:lipid-binding SYLF domain-containing protein